ncbi:hypothetical protein [Desulfonatronospira sp. MSAO_Bac3]|uniref:hypothetical protein n=1 Tax=Desulfonatronospira sp. MSAO_Bac3 TaxID=2293857 RepID=UPI000FEE9AFB|nr:hypothetical protein [Desulfonatronospira sp. MSAO_Bac3]RQD78504.1 MAG: hypothetical protein D5S03_02285 [Desulfonatronospira sp. MSAO_Bac3]
MKKLSPEGLQQVKQFVNSIILHETKNRDNYSTDIDLELSRLDLNEARHLEQEFKNYQEHYPRES